MCGESSALFNSLSSDTLSVSLCDGDIKKGEEERDDDDEGEEEEEEREKITDEMTQLIC